MKDDVRKQDAEQLNISSVSEEQASFTLDEIVREFGGWSRHENEPDAEGSDAPFTPEPVEENATQKQSEEKMLSDHQLEEKTEQPSRFTFIHLDLSTPGEAQFDPLEQQWQHHSVATEQDDLPQAPEPVTTSGSETPVKLKVLPSSQEKRHEKQRKEPKRIHVTNHAALSEAKKQTRSGLVFFLLSLIPLLTSLMLTFWLTFDWTLPLSKPQGSFANGLLLCMVVLSAVLAHDVLLRGFCALLQRSFDLNTSLGLCIVLVLIDGISTMRGTRLPLAAPICLTISLALFGSYRRNRAVYCTLRLVHDIKKPRCVVSKKEFWHGYDCLLRQDGTLNGVADAVLAPDGCEKAMRIYAPVSSVITIVLAAVIAVLTDTGYFQVASVLMVGSMPLSGFFAYTLPWSRVASRLKKNGAALLGWQGIRSLSGQKHLILRENDLFPTQNVSFNGLKICGEYRISQVVSYAATVISAAECELSALFQNLMEEYGAHSYLIGSFRRYEGGGFGAEIADDVVLAGSQRFMQLMGIKVSPELSSVKQALYLSINGELAGVFALNYKASASVRTSLSVLQRSKSITLLLASRDFLISPQLVSKRYHISSDFMEFPSVAERFDLSQPEGESTAPPAAVLSRESFASYANAVLCGRALNSVSRWGTILSILSGLIGLALMLLLTRVGAADTASAANLTQYMLLWLLPTGLLGLWAGK